MGLQWVCRRLHRGFCASADEAPYSNYSFIGFVDSDGGSESFTNRSAADLAVNGITAISFESSYMSSAALE